MRRLLLNRAIVRDHPAAVVDANLLRSPLVVAERQERYRTGGEQIVIADPVWNEIVANENWPSTLRASFKLLASVPEAVVASWSVAAMLSGEVASGEPARGIVHGPMTDFLRQLVVDLTHGGTQTMARLRVAIREHGVTDKYSMAVRRKDATARLVELGREGIPRDRLRSINNAMRRGDRSALVDLVAEVFDLSKVEGALIRRGIVPATAHRLTSQPSVTVMRNLLLTHMAVEWAATHGIENANLARVHNDYVDVEYAVIAWACGGDYVTQDQRARRRFEEGVDLCDRIWS